MEAGITDHVWDLAEVVAMIEAAAQKDVKLAA